MGSEELQLTSFFDWPLTTTVRPEVLAATGFFYTSQQDKVRCFFCSGGLQTWEQGDDPWTEHAKWFPRCEFLLQTKGRAFVCSIQESLPHPLGPWDPWEELADAAPAVSEELTVLRSALHACTWALQCYGVGSRGVPGPQGSDPSSFASRLLHTPPPEERPTWQMPGSQALEPPGAQGVEEQLWWLQQERTCKVCLDQAVSIVFVPCGYLVRAACAPSLWCCPLCRACIHSCVHIFLS